MHARSAALHNSKARGGEWEPGIVNGERQGPGYIICVWYISPGTPVAREELLPLFLFAVECLEGPVMEGRVTASPKRESKMAQAQQEGYFISYVRAIIKDAFSTTIQLNTL